MDLISIFLVALGLSADCFAVSLSSCLGARGISRVVVLRTAFAFGLFQFFMPVIGWLLGNVVVDIISGYDHWVAFALLGVVGGKMVRESFHIRDDCGEKTEIARLPVLLTLAVATSIDALAVGLSSAFLKLNIIAASSIIGVVAFAVTISGFIIGKKADHLNGKTAKLIGGLILIGIGIRILVTHLF